MSTLMQAHREWATRPDDERFTSLSDLLDAVRHDRSISSQSVQMNRAIEARPLEDREGIAFLGAGDTPTLPTHWAFGQACALVGAPAAYLRTLPSDLASDCFNQSMLSRKREQVGMMRRDSGNTPGRLAAMTGPGYGRIWNSDVVGALINRFGDGPDAEFTIPGEFGRQVPITKDNTTLFAGDRDMFIFLADERHKIAVPGRRPGETGYLSRGFFVRNSEVGAASLRIGTFLFDYVCANRIVWGAENFQEVSIRHTSGAPMRWLDEVAPALHQLASSDTFAIEHALKQARARRFDEDQVDKVLAKRFTTNQAKAIKLAHMSDEGRPMESAWDIVTGATAYARGLKHQDERVSIERVAGAVLTEAGR